MPYTNVQDDAVKVGARNSADDMKRLQVIHDYAVANGARCEAKSLGDEIMVIGLEEVKALGGGKVGGYLVRFSGDVDPDLTGDFFTSKTDFGPHTTTPVYYNHGMDGHLKRRVIGNGTLRVDDVGVWIEAQLEQRDEYERALYQLAQDGKLGWSSGTAPHLVEREPVGKAMHIKTWLLGLDASLTPTPAEPRNKAVTIKALTAQAEAAETAPVVDAIKSNPQKEPNMADEELEGVKSTLAELKTGLAGINTALEEMKRAAPAAVAAGVTVVKDSADQPFKSGGEFLMAVKTAAIGGNEDRRLIPLKASGMTGDIPADGGYLVPPAMANGIQQNMFQTGQILSRVAMTNVQGNSMTWNIVNETSRASSRFGGVVGYWLGEGSTKTASAPTFKQLELKLKKVAVLCYATDELLADAAALGSWLTREVPSELVFQTEAAMVYGDGVGKPYGIVGAPGTVSVTRVDANKISIADVSAMYARRLGNGPFVWLVNRDTMPQLMQLGSTYQYTWMPPGVWQDAPFARLLGYPVIEVEYCSTLGTVGDIILADLSMYQAIQKAGAVEAASSIHVKFTTDETAFRFVYRVDGAPKLSSAITPHKGSNTQAPFVTLSTSS